MEGYKFGDQAGGSFPTSREVKQSLEVAASLSEDMTEQELNEWIERLCISKAEEFAMLGYDNITGKDVWECVSDKYQKKGVPRLHQIVNDILSLKVTQFMNWMTMGIYKNSELKPGRI
jgi:hypothetical protein